MKVKLRVVGDFTEYPHPMWQWIEIETQPGTTLIGLLERTGIRRYEVGPATINGSLADLDSVLQDGDSVQAFSPVGGG